MEIQVAKPFKLTIDTNEVLSFEPGTHEVSDEVGNHWYTALHLEGAVEPEPAPGSYEYMQKARAQDAAERVAAQVEADIARQAEEAQKAEDMRALRQKTDKAIEKKAEQAQTAEEKK